jgi:hypothetical protein
MLPFHSNLGLTAQAKISPALRASPRPHADTPAGPDAHGTGRIGLASEAALQDGCDLRNELRGLA